MYPSVKHTANELGASSHFVSYLCSRETVTPSMSEEQDDLVEQVLDKSPDLVDIIYDNAHSRFCKNYKPFVNKHGTVYCDPCGITVSSLTDASEFHCRRCDHPKAAHNPETGVCGMCLNGCGIAGVSDYLY